MRTVPQRRCVVCGQHGEKGGLLRLVRASDASVGVDPRGKLPGRGAYVCGSCRGAFSGGGKAAAVAFRKLEHALRTTLTPEKRAALARELEEISAQKSPSEAGDA